MATATKVNLASLTKSIRTETDAYLYLENRVWNGEPRCAHCQSREVRFIEPTNGTTRATSSGSQSARRVWRCLACRKQFSVLTGTIMHGTKVSIRIWVLVMFEMCCSKNGVSAREIERKYGVCARTAWHLLHRIRQAMDVDLGPLFSGDVIADETFFGGDAKNMHHDRREAVKRGSYGKTPVVSIIDADTGKSRSKVLTWVDGASLRQAMREAVDMPVSTLHSDSHRAYPVVAAKMAGHFAVDHAAGEYVSEKSLGTQMCENFFSQLKRSIDGTHHHVTTKHLGRYVGEFDFRYSTRDLTDAERVDVLCGQVSGRLSYAALKA